MPDCLAGLARRCGDREELPLPWNRAEFVDTAVGEQHSGSDDQVLAAADLTIGKIHPVTFPYGVIEGLPA